MAQPALKALPINIIRLDGDTQTRAEVSIETISEYAEAWLEDADFPPIDVFYDESCNYFLADGFHRYLAAKRVHKGHIRCRVHRGTARDAFLFGCTANQTHGLRRKNADKRHMVSRFLSDDEWIQCTDSWIAEQCGVSHTFVASMRREQENKKGSPAAKFRCQPRRGVDGKNYPARFKSHTSSDGRRAKSDKENDSQAGRRKALSLLRKMTPILQRLEIYEKHEIALAAIERDLSGV